MEIALRLEDVHKALGRGFLPRKRPVLKGVSFDVHEGEIFGFLGPNGSGKTTTIKTALNLLRLDRGRIELFGVPHTRPSARRRIGFLPENPYFYDYLTGLEFLKFYGALAGLSAPERRARSGELLERIGLADAASLALRKYSRGMLQRVGLAQALIADPDLLLLDEPLAGLDPFGRKDVRDLLVELRDRGKTVFFSSHILADAEMLCDRVGILRDGRVECVAMRDLAQQVPEQRYEIVCRGIKREALKDFTVALEKDGAHMVHARDAKEKDKLLALVALNGGTVESVVPQKPSLEALLVKLFERPAREDAGAPALRSEASAEDGDGPAT
ncbi:MAG: ABC transporter ATP-binding protein [Acidobacteriota bacterium]|nr:MAG: ABC transporter ATP-binding protein [Acidobacteriota bacterium]